MFCWLYVLAAAFVPFLVDLFLLIPFVALAVTLCCSSVYMLLRLPVLYCSFPEYLPALSIVFLVLFSALIIVVSVLLDSLWFLYLMISPFF